MSEKTDRANSRRPLIGGVAAGAGAYGGWLFFETWLDGDWTWDQLIPLTAVVALVLVGVGALGRLPVILGVGVGVALGFLAVFGLTLAVILSIGDV